MSKKLHLHLDADTSSKALHTALLARGHDVTRTPTEWMPLDASDEQQLLGATAQGRAILRTIFGTLSSWENVIRVTEASFLLFKRA